jgi:hypothetical protein
MPVSPAIRATILIPMCIDWLGRWQSEAVIEHEPRIHERREFKLPGVRQRKLDDVGQVALVYARGDLALAAAAWESRGCLHRVVKASFQKCCLTTVTAPNGFRHTNCERLQVNSF